MTTWGHAARLMTAITQPGAALPPIDPAVDHRLEALRERELRALLVGVVAGINDSRNRAQTGQAYDDVRQHMKRLGLWESPEAVDARKRQAAEGRAT